MTALYCAVVKTFDIRQLRHSILRDLRNHGDKFNVKKKKAILAGYKHYFFTNETKESLVSRSDAHVVGT